MTLSHGSIEKIRLMVASSFLSMRMRLHFLAKHFSSSILIVLKEEEVVVVVVRLLCFQMMAESHMAHRVVGWPSKRTGMAWPLR
jgi:hypothetical protein